MPVARSAVQANSDGASLQNERKRVPAGRLTPLHRGRRLGPGGFLALDCGKRSRLELSLRVGDPGGRLAQAWTVAPGSSCSTPAATTPPTAGSGCGEAWTDAPAPTSPDFFPTAGAGRLVRRGTRLLDTHRPPRGEPRPTEVTRSDGKGQAGRARPRNFDDHLLRQFRAPMSRHRSRRRSPAPCERREALAARASGLDRLAARGRAQDLGQRPSHRFLVGGGDVSVEVLLDAALVDGPGRGQILDAAIGDADHHTATIAWVPFSTDLPVSFHLVDEAAD